MNRCSRPVFSGRPSSGVSVSECQSRGAEEGLGRMSAWWGPPRVCVCKPVRVWWHFCPWLGQRPGGSCLQTGVGLEAQNEQRGVGGLLTGKAYGGPFVSDRESAVGAMMGIPFELGAFLFGVLAPWTASVVRGSPTCRTVDSGRLELVGEATAGHFPSEWTAKGLVWQVCVCLCLNLGHVCLWSCCLPGVGFLSAAEPGPSTLVAGPAIRDAGVLWFGEGPG